MVLVISRLEPNGSTVSALAHINEVDKGAIVREITLHVGGAVINAFLSKYGTDFTTVAMIESLQCLRYNLNGGNIVAHKEGDSYTTREGLTGQYEADGFHVEYPEGSKLKPSIGIDLDIDQLMKIKKMFTGYVPFGGHADDVIQHIPE